MMSNRQSYMYIVYHYITMLLFYCARYHVNVHYMYMYVYINMYMHMP